MSPSRFVKVPVQLLFPRSIQPDEMPRIRPTWFHPARAGRQLPVEKNFTRILRGRR